MVQKALMAEAQSTHRTRQALADIENQLNGSSVKPEEDETHGTHRNTKFSKERRAIHVCFNRLV